MAANRSVKTALATGCSSGIGRAAAIALVKEGYCVWAGVRRVESLEELESVAQSLRGTSEGSSLNSSGASSSGFQSPSGVGILRPILIDVADPGSVDAVFKTIAETSSSLNVLINNAGYGQFGALEDLDEDQFRRQYEINVSGMWRTTRRALPLLRAGGPGGTIINVSSILGRLTFAFGGAYSSSKFAVEALSDAFRQEVAPWGIRVVIIEPGPIATQFNQNAMAAASFEKFEKSVYSPIYKALEAYYQKENRWGRLPPESVAEVMMRAIRSSRPRTRYLVTAPAKFAALLRRWAPDRFIDWMAARYLGVSGIKPKG